MTTSGYEYAKRRTTAQLIAELKPRRNKYGAIRCEMDGFKFASRREMKRYADLKLLERGKQISELTVHPQFDLSVNAEHICKYTADFSYRVGTKFIVEDVKGGAVTQTEAFKLRKRLMKALLNIDVQVVA